VKNFVNDTTDGANWMSIDDFYAEYWQLVVGYYIDSNYNNYLEIANDTSDGVNYNTYNFTLTQDAYAWVGLDFYPLKMYANFCKAVLNYNFQIFYANGTRVATVSNSRTNLAFYNSNYNG
jgi:hypothetical protein